MIIAIRFGMAVFWKLAVVGTTTSLFPAGFCRARFKNLAMALGRKNGRFALLSLSALNGRGIEGDAGAGLRRPVIFRVNSPLPPCLSDALGLH